MAGQNVPQYYPPVNPQNPNYGYNAGYVGQGYPISNQPGQPLLVQPIIVGNSQGRTCCSDTLKFVLYTISVGLEILWLILVLIYRWFGYCYWAFGLNQQYKIIANGHSVGDNDDTIADFYDSLCSSKSSNPIPECPHICKSLYYVRHSGDIMYGFGSVVIVISIASFILAALKYKKPNSKLKKNLVYLFNSASFILYLIGFIAYIVSSQFTENFDDIDTHPRSKWTSGDEAYEFYWSFGLVFSLFILGAQFMKFVFLLTIFRYIKE